MADLLYLDPAGPGSVGSTLAHRRPPADPYDDATQALDAEIAALLDDTARPSAGETDADAEDRLWAVLDALKPDAHPAPPRRPSPPVEVDEEALELSIRKRDLAGLLGMLTEAEEQQLIADKVRLAALQSGGRVVLLADARDRRRRR